MRFTQEEYYTMRQRVQIQSLLAHATRNIASGQSLQESLTIYDVLHRIVSDDYARTIFNTDLTKLYEKTQLIVAKRAETAGRGGGGGSGGGVGGGGGVGVGGVGRSGAKRTSSSSAATSIPIVTLPPIPGFKQSNSNKNQSSPILSAIMKS